MFLYNLTLSPPAVINNAVLGNFSGTKVQELVVSHGSRIELLRPDPNTGTVHSVLSHEVFGQIRSLAPFRLTGGSKGEEHLDCSAENVRWCACLGFRRGAAHPPGRTCVNRPGRLACGIILYTGLSKCRSLLSYCCLADYIIIGSDSGRIVILEYNPTKNVLEKVHQETYGKSGVRRVVPGQYLAVDPKGRAVGFCPPRFITAGLRTADGQFANTKSETAAVEKQKLVYILNRDALNPLTISSPLEAHRSHTICFSCVGLDVGFENPVFACLEMEYNDEIEADEDEEGLAGEK
ncbi:MAG: hypothetical protein BJ554DRAFT_3571, partial [Olpidium bornovanus]